MTALTTAPAVTDRMMRTVRRQMAESIAEKYIDGRITDDDLDWRLQRVSPLPTTEALVQAIQLCQDVADGMVTTAEVEPGLAHPDVLAEAAQRQVNDALEELIGDRS